MSVAGKIRGEKQQEIQYKYTLSEFSCGFCTRVLAMED